MGLEVELEHGRKDPTTNVTDDDEVTTGKIARAHLNEFPDYYTRLAEMEAEAERYWSKRRGGSASQRPQSVEDDREVDDLLEQGAGERWEVTDGGYAHRGEAESHARRARSGGRYGARDGRCGPRRRRDRRGRR